MRGRRTDRRISAFRCSCLVGRGRTTGGLARWDGIRFAGRRSTISILRSSRTRRCLDGGAAGRSGWTCSSGGAVQPVQHREHEHASEHPGRHDDHDGGCAVGDDQHDERVWNDQQDGGDFEADSVFVEADLLKGSDQGTKISHSGTYRDTELFVAKCLNRVQICRLPRWIDSEQQTNRARDPYREQDPHG